MGRISVYKLHSISNNFSKTSESKMAARKEKTIFVRSFIIEHNGTLFRYTEKVEELAKTGSCATIDVTIDDETERAIASPPGPTSGKKSTIGIACYDDDLAQIFKKRKLSDDQSTNSDGMSKNSNHSPSPTYDPTDSDEGADQSPIYRPTTPAYV